MKNAPASSTQAWGERLLALNGGPRLPLSANPVYAFEGYATGLVTRLHVLMV